MDDAIATGGTAAAVGALIVVDVIAVVAFLDARTDKAITTARGHTGADTGIGV